MHEIKYFQLSILFRNWEENNWIVLNSLKERCLSQNFSVTRKIKNPSVFPGAGRKSSGESFSGVRRFKRRGACCQACWCRNLSLILGTHMVGRREPTFVMSPDSHMLLWPVHTQKINKRQKWNWPLHLLQLCGESLDFCQCCPRNDNSRCSVFAEPR